MRDYGQSVAVELDPVGRPQSFVWRGRRYRVEKVLARWRERTPWWRIPVTDGALPQSERTVWRVEAAPGRLPYTGVFELADVATPHWLLLRLTD